MLCYDDDDDYIPLVEMTVAESSQTALSQSDDVGYLPLLAPQLQRLRDITARSNLRAALKGASDVSGGVGVARHRLESNRKTAADTAAGVRRSPVDAGRHSNRRRLAGTLRRRDLPEP